MVLYVFRPSPALSLYLSRRAHPCGRSVRAGQGRDGESDPVALFTEVTSIVAQWRHFTPVTDTGETLPADLLGHSVPFRVGFT